MKRVVLFAFVLLFAASLFAIVETENNDTFGTADPIGTGYHSVLVEGEVSIADDDYWVYDVNPGNEMTVTILVGEGHFDVNVYNAAEELIGTFGVGSGVYTFPYIAPDNGPNYILIYNSDGDLVPYEILIVNANDPTLPVELSSFSASVTASNFVSIEWITQTETDMLGYNILRSETAEVSEALLVSDGLIPAQNQSIETSYQFIDQDVEMESTYWYWLESVEATSESDLHGPVSVTLAGGGDGGGDTPEVIYVTALENNYPNPFNPSTSIVYTLAEDSAVDVAVYNSRGQLVRMLHDSKPKGRHSIVWNGRDSAGADCASGVYYFHLNACGQTDIIKGILIK